MQPKIAQNSLALSALVTLLAPLAAQAQSAPEFTWYGRIDMAIESNSDGQDSRLGFSNFASRLGIRGQRSWGDVTGLFQVETGVAPDDTANSKAFANRNSFVGVENKALGRVLVGTYDMPLKELEGTSGGLFGQGDLNEIITHGKGSNAAQSALKNVHTRQTNVLRYASPKFGNLVTVKFAYSPGTGNSVAGTSTDGATAATATAPKYNQAVLGLSAEYDDGLFNAGVATQSAKNAVSQPTLTAAGANMKGTKLTAGAKFGPAAVGVAYSRLDAGDVANRKTRNWVLSGQYALTDAIVTKLSLGRASETRSGADDGFSGLALEGDYKLDKSTTAYVYYTQLRNSTNGKATLVGSDNFPKAAAAGKDPRALGVGIRYNF